MPNGTYTVFYYPTATASDDDEGIDIQKATDFIVSSGKVSKDKFKNSLFTVQTSTSSSNIYKVQQITLEEDGLVAIVATEFPVEKVGSVDNVSSIAKIITDNDKYTFKGMA